VTDLIVTTPEQLRALIREELERVLAGRGTTPGAAADWVTAEQAAELLGVGPKTVRRWAAAGRLRAEHRGRVWRIDRAGLPAERPATPEAEARVALAAIPR